MIEVVIEVIEDIRCGRLRGKVTTSIPNAIHKNGAGKLNEDLEEKFIFRIPAKCLYIKQNQEYP